MMSFTVSSVLKVTLIGLAWPWFIDFFGCSAPLRLFHYSCIRFLILNQSFWIGSSSRLSCSSLGSFGLLLGLKIITFFHLCNPSSSLFCSSFASRIISLTGRNLNFFLISPGQYNWRCLFSSWFIMGKRPRYEFVNVFQHCFHLAHGRVMVFPHLLLERITNGVYLHHIAQSFYRLGAAIAIPKAPTVPSCTDRLHLSLQGIEHTGVFYICHIR